MSRERRLKPAKIENIQALRGLAALMVVGYHLGKVEGKYGGAPPVLPGFTAVGLAGVDLFFVISGFIMVMITVNAFRDYEAFKKYIYNRLTRIYPLYWLFSALVLVVYVLQPTWVNSSQGGRVDILASFLLLPQKQLPLLMVGWTLVHEVYFYAVFGGMRLLVRRRHLAGALLAWAGLPLVPFLVDTGDSALGHILFHPLTLEFIAGGLLALLYDRNWQGTRANALWALLAAAALLAGHAFLKDFSGRAEPGDWERVVLFGLPAAVMVHTLVAMERNGRQCLPRWLIDIGNASYSIYLSHILVLSVVGRVWRAIGWGGRGGNHIMLGIMLAAVVAFGMVCYRYIEKPLLKIFRWATSG